MFPNYNSIPFKSGVPSSISRKWVVGEGVKLHLYLQALPIARISAWALPLATVNQWCRDKCNVFESFWNHPHETHPWCWKGWGIMVLNINPPPLPEPPATTVLLSVSMNLTLWVSHASEIILYFSIVTGLMLLARCPHDLPMLQDVPPNVRFYLLINGGLPAYMLFFAPPQIVG